MLDSLVSERTSREVWWLHAARCGAEHAFAGDARGLVARLPHRHLHVRYSSPAPDDALGDYDATGHLSADLMAELGIPREAEFFLCGPPGFMTDLSAGLITWGVAPVRSTPSVSGLRTFGLRRWCPAARAAPRTSPQAQRAPAPRSPSRARA